jgi:osmotically-inducible protein OsmY
MQTQDINLATRVKLFLTAMRSSLSSIAVSTPDDQTIRLTGDVDSFYLRQLAIGGAQRVAGVRKIEDRIRVHVRPLTVAP